MCDAGPTVGTAPEKGIDRSLCASTTMIDPEAQEGNTDETGWSDNVLYRWVQRFEKLAGAEARGIERVPESLRSHKVALADYVQMAIIWFSANLTANNVLLGLLGPLVFDLGLNDCLLLGTFGGLVGAAACGYISTFGPLSGNRTLVGILKYIYFPSVGITC